MKTIQYSDDHFTYLGMKPVSHPGMRSIVSRLHVGESFLSVVRHVLTKLKGKRKEWLKYPKNQRRYAIAAAIQHHRENRVQYRQVMACSREEFVPRYYFDNETKWVHIAPDLLPSDLAAIMKQAV
jgi:hypothetical protein